MVYHDPRDEEKGASKERKGVGIRGELRRNFMAGKKGREKKQEVRSW